MNSPKRRGSCEAEVSDSKNDRFEVIRAVNLHNMVEIFL